MGLGLAGQGVNAKGVVVRSFFKWCDASMLGAYYYYAGGAVDRISAPSRAITFFKEGRSRIDGTRSLTLTPTPTPAVASSPHQCAGWLTTNQTFVRSPAGEGPHVHSGYDYQLSLSRAGQAL